MNHQERKLKCSYVQNNPNFIIFYINIILTSSTSLSQSLVVKPRHHTTRHTTHINPSRFIITLTKYSTSNSLALCGITGNLVQCSCVARLEISSRIWAQSSSNNVITTVHSMQTSRTEKSSLMKIKLSLFKLM